MIWVDYLILVIILISVLISVVRGFVREAISLAGWLLSLWVALTFSDRLAAMLESHIDTPSLRYMLAFTLLFTVSMVLALAVNRLVSHLVQKTGLSSTDRAVGVFFGLARGAIVVAILVYLGGMTAMSTDPWWSNSLLVVHFYDLAAWLSHTVLPSNVVANF